MKTNAELARDCYAEVIKSGLPESVIKRYLDEKDVEMAQLTAESAIDQRNAAMSQQESSELLDKAELLRSTIIDLIDTLTMHRIEDHGSYAMVDAVELNQAVERARKVLIKMMSKTNRSRQ